MSSRDRRIASLAYNYTKGKPWLSSYRKYYGRYLSSNKGRYYRSRPLGLPATRGWKGTIGPYRRGQTELKAVDTANNVTAHTTPTGILLNGILQGQDYFTRIGREIVIKSLNVHMVWYSDIASAEPAAFRWIIVWDTQANGTIATFAQVFGQTGTTLTSVDTTSHLNLDNRDRFRVVYDKVGVLNLGAASTISFANVKKYRKMNVRVVYQGTDAMIGSIATNSLVLFAISNYATGTTGPTCEYNIRLRFTDC